MISKAKIKYIRSLSRKKERDEERVFTAEGEKLVADLLPHFSCLLLCATRPELTENVQARETAIVTEADMAQLTGLVTPSPVLAVFSRPAEVTADELLAARGPLLALDGVRDPGNLGTIIRTADWFGIHYILCSSDTADLYNPKVVQATMGAIARAKLCYAPIEPTLSDMKRAGWGIAGTFLGGENIYRADLSCRQTVYVMGNEGRGISSGVARLVDRRLLIPAYPSDAATSESLNVATATAIVLSEVRRRG